MHILEQRQQEPVTYARPGRFADQAICVISFTLRCSCMSMPLNLFELWRACSRIDQDCATVGPVPGSPAAQLGRDQ